MTKITPKSITDVARVNNILNTEYGLHCLTEAAAKMVVSAGFQVTPLLEYPESPWKPGAGVFLVTNAFIVDGDVRRAKGLWASYFLRSYIPSINVNNRTKMTEYIKGTKVTQVFYDEYLPTATFNRGVYRAYLIFNLLQFYGWIPQMSVHFLQETMDMREFIATAESYICDTCKRNYSVIPTNMTPREKDCILCKSPK